MAFYRRQRRRRRDLNTHTPLILLHLLTTAYGTKRTSRDVRFYPLLEDKRTSATAVEPAPRNLIHPDAHLVVLISEVARSFEPADDGPIA
ncbi:MAG TPA: hypothetical protein VKC66_06555, partial [Xanthobacteraceae bacterium]|nr:hypothetical protein [Xanthobacteraceae bacterium]